MASTRNINTPSDYCLQQRSFWEARSYDFISILNMVTPQILPFLV